jgi:hypothetical protein
MWEHYEQKLDEYNLQVLTLFNKVVVNGRFGGELCIDLQGWTVIFAFLLPFAAVLFGLLIDRRMEVVPSSKSLWTYPS